MSKPVKYLVSGWYELDGIYRAFKKLVTDEEQVKEFQHLMALRNDESIHTKVEKIEVIWNAD